MSRVLVGDGDSYQRYCLTPDKVAGCRSVSGRYDSGSELTDRRYCRNIVNNYCLGLTIKWECWIYDSLP